MGSLDELAALAQLANDSSQPAAKRARPADACVLPADLTVEPYSGLKVKTQTRRLSRADVDSLASTFAVKKLDEVPFLIRGPTPSAVPSAWLTIAVLVDKGPAKPTARGDSFCVWKMSDLRQTTLSVFLFGDAFSHAWKELPGTVFAILTPRPVPPKEGAAALMDGGALSIEKHTQLQHIGTALDFALCKGERRDGKPCGMWVNRSECEYCEYHAAAALRQLTSSKASATNSKKMTASGLGAGAARGSVSAHPVSGLPNGRLAEQLRPGWSATSHLGRGPSLMTRMVPDAAAAQIAHAKALLTHYGYDIPEPDPNALDPFAEHRKIARDIERGNPTNPPMQHPLHGHHEKQSNKVPLPPHPLGGDRSYSRTVPASSTCVPPPRKASAFAQSFGTVDVASNEGKEVLGAKPVHAQAERDGARNALHQRLDVLKKRDELTTKMESRTCIDVTAQRCMQCEYLQIRALPECKERGHDLRAIKVKQRGFSCTKCKQHTTVLNKRMPDACTKCGGTAWKEAGVRGAAKVAAAPSEDFLPRGEEVGRFRNSEPSRSAMAPIPRARDQTARPSNPNMWQAELPVEGEQR